MTETVNKLYSSRFSVPLKEEEKQALGKVGVLFGGDSAEREISLQSGNAVLSALQRANVDAVGLDVKDDVLNRIQQAELDKVFIMLHGVGGEDGRVQALLNYLNLPFTGSAHPASALAMDKLRSKQLWNGMDLPTPEFRVLARDSDWKAVLDQLGGEVMVKPSHEGSSLGMSKANSAEGLKVAYEKAEAFDCEVIAERVISGAEYSIAILADRALPPIELYTDNVFYDYDAKYVSDDTQFICPANLSEEKSKEISELALCAFQSLGCKGWGRVDVMADQKGNFYVLEVNTIPGMTDHSLVPIAAKTAGISFEQLVLDILLQAER